MTFSTEPTPDYLMTPSELAETECLLSWWAERFLACLEDYSNNVEAALAARTLEEFP